MWMVKAPLQRSFMTSPCLDNTLDFCKRVLNAHGTQADQTLEYIGISLKDNEITEHRLYQQKTPLLTEQLRNDPLYAYLLEELMGSFYRKQTIRLCDISKSFALGEQTFRAVFKFPKKQQKSEAAQDIHDFFSCLSGSDEYRKRLTENLLKFEDPSGSVSPLLQIGVELNRSYRLRGIKYYLRMRDFSFLKDLDPDWQGLPEQRHNQLSECGYKPIFVGINDYDGTMEKKLYFISKAVGFKKPEILESQKTLANAFGWNIPEEVFNGLHEMNLYAEGIAFCAQNGTWRLYFKEFMPRQQSSISANEREGARSAAPAPTNTKAF